MRYLQAVPSNKVMHLDLKDKRILLELSQDARISRSILARKVQLSKDSVLYRINNYLKSGLIQGFRTVVDVELLGYGIYHVLLQLNKPAVEVEQKILESLKKQPFIRAIIKYTGRYDFQIAMIARNPKELSSFLTIIMKECDNNLHSYEVLTVTNTYTSRSLPENYLSNEKSNEKQKQRSVTKTDDVDFKILSLIADNALMNYVDISKKIGTSHDMISFRIKRMISSGLIKSFIPAINSSALSYSMYCIMLQINNPEEYKLKQALITDKNIIWAVKCIGRYNTLTYVLVNSPNQLHETITQIRTLFPQKIMDYDIMLAYEEYKYTYFPEILKKTG